jgi:hypothetical protein
MKIKFMPVSFVLAGALKWDSSGYDEYCNIAHFRWEGEVPTMQAEMLEFPDGHPLIPLRLDRITIEDGAFNVQSEKPDLSFPNDAMLKLIDGHILTARIKNQEGDRHESSLDLDNYLGNNNCTSYVKYFPSLLRQSKLIGLFFVSQFRVGQ